MTFGLIIGGTAFWNAIVGGLAAGSVYALVAYGYSLVFLSTDVFNFAQGDLVSLGAIIGYTLLVSLGSPAIVALIGAIVFAGAVGAGEWLVFVAPVIQRGSTLAWLVTTLAFSIVVENVLIQAGWSGSTFHTFQWPFGSQVIHIGGVVIPPAYIGAFVAAILVALGLGYMYGRTMFGKAMLAMAEDREAARMRGVSVLRFATFAFGLGGMLSGLAGFIVAPSETVSYSLGNSLGSQGLCRACTGWLRQSSRRAFRRVGVWPDRSPSCLVRVGGLG